MLSNWRKHRLDVDRKRRLLSKAQKANCMDRVKEVLEQPSWNKRFNTIQSMRAERVF